MRVLFLIMGALVLAGCGEAGPAADRHTHIIFEDNQGGAVLGDVITGPVWASAGQAEPSYSVHPLSSACATPRPSPGAKIAYITVYGRGHDSALWRVSEQGPMVAIENVGNANVVITETERPVFLFVSSYDGDLWNIHLAPGAKLDGVVVSSYDPAFVAADIPRARAGFLQFRDSPNRKCYRRVTRPFTVNEAVANVRPGYKVTAEDRKRYAQAAREARSSMTWAAQRFGRPDVHFANQLPTGENAQSYLIGPVPDKPVRAQPISQIIHSGTNDLFWGSTREAFKMRKARREALRATG